MHCISASTHHVTLFLTHYLYFFDHSNLWLLVDPQKSTLINPKQTRKCTAIVLFKTQHGQFWTVGDLILTFTVSHGDNESNGSTRVSFTTKIYMINWIKIYKQKANQFHHVVGSAEHTGLNSNLWVNKEHILNWGHAVNWIFLTIGGMCMWIQTSSFSMYPHLI